MIKRLSNIAEIHDMIFNAQIKVKHKHFMILILDLLINQVHAV